MGFVEGHSDVVTRLEQLGRVRFRIQFSYLKVGVELGFVPAYVLEQRVSQYVSLGRVILGKRGELLACETVYFLGVLRFAIWRFFVVLSVELCNF